MGFVLIGKWRPALGHQQRNLINARNSEECLGSACHPVLKNIMPNHTGCHHDQVTIRDLSTAPKISTTARMGWPGPCPTAAHCQAITNTDPRPGEAPNLIRQRPQYDNTRRRQTEPDSDHPARPPISESQQSRHRQRTIRAPHAPGAILTNQQHHRKKQIPKSNKTTSLILRLRLHDN